MSTGCCVRTPCPPISSRFRIGTYSLLPKKNRYWHDHYHRHIHCDEYVVDENSDCLANAIAGTVSPNTYPPISLLIDNCCAVQYNLVFDTSATVYTFETYPMLGTDCAAITEAQLCADYLTTDPDKLSVTVQLSAVDTADALAAGATLYPDGYFEVTVTNPSLSAETVTGLYAFVGQATDASCILTSFNICSGQIAQDRLEVLPGETPDYQCRFPPFPGTAVTYGQPYHVVIALKTVPVNSTCCLQTQKTC